MVNFDLIIKRIEDLKGVRGDKHVAAILGLSPQDFSNRKKRGSLLPAIFEWAINESVNLDWLIKGQENSYHAASTLDGHEIYTSTIGPLSKPKTVNFRETKKDNALIQQLKRIIQDGDKTKLEAIKATLKALDPGENKQNAGG